MGFNIHHSLSSIFPGTEVDGFTNPFNHSLCKYLPGAWCVSGTVLVPKGRWTRPTFQWSLHSSGSEQGLSLLPTKSFCLNGLERKRAGDTGILRDKYFREAIPLTIRVCPGGSLKCEIAVNLLLPPLAQFPLTSHKGASQISSEWFCGIFKGNFDTRILPYTLEPYSHTP